jgi:hypothetical protein
MVCGELFPLSAHRTWIGALSSCAGPDSLLIVLSIHQTQFLFFLSKVSHARRFLAWSTIVDIHQSHEIHRGNLNSKNA